MILQLKLGQNIGQLGIPVELVQRVVGHENRDRGGGEGFGVGGNREERLRSSNSKQGNDRS